MSFTKYDVLGIKKNATIDEIRTAYKTQSKKWHPDKNPNNVAEATKKIQEINDAYKILSDERKRQIYDQTGDEGFEQMESNGGGNPFDILNMFRRNAPKKAPPLLHKAEITLTELYTGTLHKFRVTTRADCTGCDGTGSASKVLRECIPCKGTGTILKTFQRGQMTQHMQTTCGTCQGSGKKQDKADTCGMCRGREFMEVEKKLEFQVQPGMSWGTRVVMAGDGHQLRDHVDGDLVIELVEKMEKPTNNPVFTRSGNNLNITLPISLHGALLGLKYPLFHLDGKCLLIKVDQVITPTTIKCVRNAGMPIFSQEHIENPPKDSEREYGDLVIRFEIKFPETLSPEVREKLNPLLDGNLEKTLNKKLPKTYAEPEMDTYYESKEKPRRAQTQNFDEGEFGTMYEESMPHGVQCAQQ